MSIPLSRAALDAEVSRLSANDAARRARPGVTPAQVAGLARLRPGDHGDFGQWALQVRDRRTQKIRLLPKSADPDVAGVAEDPAYPPGVVLVINAQRDAAVRRTAAYRASGSLRSEKPLVLLNADAVEALSEPTLRPLVLTAPATPCSRGRMDVGILWGVFMTFRAVGNAPTGHSRRSRRRCSRTSSWHASEGRNYGIDLQ